MLYPLIARPRFHAFGKDFIVLRNSKEFKYHYSEHAPQGWYYSQYVNKVQEFRIHIGHSKVLCVLEKQGDKNSAAWNMARTNQSAIVVNPTKWNLAAVREAIKAVKVSGVDFAGVDVMFDRDGKAYVLELNTTPLMCSSSLISESYARYFDWLADSHLTRSHFDVVSNKPEDYMLNVGDEQEVNLLK